MEFYFLVRAWLLIGGVAVCVLVALLSAFGGR